jgi:hypothetical protein
MNIKDLETKKCASKLTMKSIGNVIILLAVFIAVSQVKTFGQDSVPTKKYDRIEAYKYDGFALVILNQKQGLIDKNGEEFIPCKYDKIIGTTIMYTNVALSVFFVDGFVTAMLDNKYGFIDINGKEITPFKYSDARPFTNGMAAVEYNGKCGFINTNGEEVIPCKYEDSLYNTFEDGICPVTLDGKSIYIDEQGNEYRTRKEALKAIKKAAGR